MEAGSSAAGRVDGFGRASSISNASTWCLGMRSTGTDASSGRWRSAMADPELELVSRGFRLISEPLRRDKAGDSFAEPDDDFDGSGESVRSLRTREPSRSSRRRLLRSSSSSGVRVLRTVSASGALSLPWSDVRELAERRSLRDSLSFRSMGGLLLLEPRELDSFRISGGEVVSLLSAIGVRASEGRKKQAGSQDSRGCVPRRCAFT